jgi:hypothetical protein
MRLTQRVLFVGVAAAAVALPVAANAQVPIANAYKADATTKAVWPPFYKPDKQDAAYAEMMANGYCKPNGWRAQSFYQSKMLDVNTLPSASLKGKITEVKQGLVTAFDDKQAKAFSLIIHENPAISSVHLNGKATTDALVPGAMVRFVARVDASGQALDKLSEIELTTPGRDHLEPVEPQKSQNVVGKILRRDGAKLVVQAPPGKIARVTVELATNAVVNAHLAEHARAAVGDEVSGKGRVFHSDVINKTLFFVDELDIAANAPLGPKAKTTK